MSFQPPLNFKFENIAVSRQRLAAKRQQVSAASLSEPQTSSLVGCRLRVFEEGVVHLDAVGDGQHTRFLRLFIILVEN